jgi:ABC-type glutathione transport system ATPase component
MGNPTLEIRDLCAGAIPAAFRGISFTVGRGEAVALLGDRGAGKSQLLQCIGLDLPPSSGSVLVGNVEVTGCTGERRRQLRARGIELVHPPTPFHESDHSAPGAPTTTVLRRRSVTVPVTGLRQRIQIARALTQNVAVLLLDEPFAGVDLVVRDRIRELLLRARTEAGTTVVVATREPEVARQLSDRVLVLHEGEIIESGPTRDVLRAPRDARTRELVRVRRSA